VIGAPGTMINGTVRKECVHFTIAALFSSERKDLHRVTLSVLNCFSKNSEIKGNCAT